MGSGLHAIIGVAGLRKPIEYPRRHPLAWVAVYALMIVGFTFVYIFKSSGFYQSTATREPAFATATASVTNMLVSELVDYVDQVAQANYGEATPELHGIVIENVRSDDQHVILTLAFKERSGPDSAPFVTATMQLDPLGDYKPRWDEGHMLVPYSLTGPPAKSLNTRLHDSQNPYAILTGYPAGEQPMLRMTPAEQRQLKNYWRASQGYVDALADRKWRLLYLSAVTATTLGFGDIVPVTTYTRLLVTAEAALGVLIIGLFLNDLARRARDISPVVEVDGHKS